MVEVEVEVVEVKVGRVDVVVEVVVEVTVEMMVEVVVEDEGRGAVMVPI